MIAGSPFIGTAGWSIPSFRHADAFRQAGTHLERYASRFNAVEINSSFNRQHRRETYERWAASVPADFRFSVKIPRTITHDQRLADCDALLDGFFQQVGGLGGKLGVLLMQTPPNMAFTPETAEPFLQSLRQRTEIGIACEPRHASWFTPAAARLLENLRIARVTADPVRPKDADMSGGWPGLAYFRMHGSPRIYYSDYPPDVLQDLKRRMDDKHATGSEVWCIFDNTAANNALGNAMAIAAMR